MNTKPCNEKKYWIIKNALDKNVCQLITDYALLQSEVKPRIWKHQDPLAHVHRAYGDPLMEVLLERLLPLIEAQVGKKLWPTLSFYYTYRHQHELPKHTDRSSCEYVASICLGADANFLEQHGTWPLMLELDGQSSAVSLERGDVLIFKGYETVHWRQPYEGQWFVSAIFAYVDQAGPMAFQKFDQRSRLGLPHVGMVRWLWKEFRNRHGLSKLHIDDAH